MMSGMTISRFIKNKETITIQDGFQRLGWIQSLILEKFKNRLFHSFPHTNMNIQVNLTSLIFHLMPIVFSFLIAKK